MIQAGSWQEILTFAEKLTQTLTRQLFKSLGNSSGLQPQPLSLIGQRIWLTGLTALVLWMINWRLVLAMAAGFGSFKLLNWLNQKHWQPLEGLFQSGLNPVNPSLTGPLTDPLIGMIGGSIVATLGTYMAASILMSADSYWVATGSILQGLITFAIFCLLIGRTGRRLSPPSFDKEQLLGDLTHADPLKRLIAVRQMTRLATQNNPEQVYLSGCQLSLRSHLTDCFRLMICQESDPIVRAAIRECLQLINPKPQLPKGAPPLASPVALQRSASQLHRHQVDYVEP